MTTNRPDFKAHDDFNFEHKKIGKITREQFIKYIRSSHDHMRKLSQIIQQYDQTMDDYLNEWDGQFESFDDDVKDLLGRWIEDGTMDHIINENLMSSKADKTYVDELHDSTTAQLDQSEEKTFFDSMVNSKANKKYLAWIDDDGALAFYDYFKGLYEDYGTVFNSAIVTSWIGNSNRMSVEQMLELQDLGFGFPSHSHVHDTNNRLNNMTEAELHDNFRQTRQVMADVGLKSDVFVYPFGAHNNLVKDVLRQYFKAGIHTASGGVGFYNPFPADQYVLERIDVHNGNTETFPILEEAASKNEPVILMSHINQSRWLDDTDIRALIAKCLSLGYEFVSIDKLVQETGNVAQFGNTIIGRDGSITSDSLIPVEFPGINVSLINAPITAFPVNKVTKLRIRDVDAVAYGLTTGQGGGINVHRYPEDAYSYREFIGRRGGDIRYSHWDIVSGEWGPWINDGNTLYVGPNDFPKNAPITVFPFDKKVRIKIRNADAVDYGISGGVGGYIDVHRDKEEFYSYQHFISPRSKRELYRYWDIANSEWSVWEGMSYG